MAFDGDKYSYHDQDEEPDPFGPNVTGAVCGVMLAVLLIAAAAGVIAFVALIVSPFIPGGR